MTWKGKIQNNNKYMINRCLQGVGLVCSTMWSVHCFQRTCSGTLHCSSVLRAECCFGNETSDKKASAPRVWEVVRRLKMTGSDLLLRYATCASRVNICWWYYKEHLCLVGDREIEEKLTPETRNPGIRTFNVLQNLLQPSPFVKPNPCRLRGW